MAKQQSENQKINTSNRPEAILATSDTTKKATNPSDLVAIYCRNLENILN